MDITMIGLQNAGKTSLLRVLAVSVFQIGKWQRYITTSLPEYPTDEMLSREESLLLSASILALGCASCSKPKALLYAPMSFIVMVGPSANGHSSIPTVGFNMKRVQKGHVTLKW